MSPYWFYCTWSPVNNAAAYGSWQCCPLSRKNRRVLQSMGLWFPHMLAINSLALGYAAVTLNKYTQNFIIRRTKSKKLNVSRLFLQFFLPDPLKLGIESRMKMQLEQRRQAMLQLHLSDQQVYCTLRCVSYCRFDGTLCVIYIRISHMCVSDIISENDYSSHWHVCRTVQPRPIH